MRSFGEMAKSKRLTYELVTLVAALFLAGGALGYQASAVSASVTTGLLVAVYLAACVSAGAYVILGVLRTLRKYERILDTLPVSVAVLDSDLHLAYENKAAGQAPGREAYEGMEKILQIPEGYVLTGDIKRSVSFDGGEYRLTISPIDEGKSQSYLLVYDNVSDILGKKLQREELMETVTSIVQQLNRVINEYRTGSNALVSCTKRQAETMHQVATILNSIFDRKSFEASDLSMLNDAAVLMNSCVGSGGKHAAQLAKTADEMVKASQSIENTVKVMHNIL